MNYNKNNYAALFNRLMSSLLPMTSKTEHITYSFMPQKLVCFLLLLFTFSIANGQVCQFNPIGTGQTCEEPIPLCNNVSGELPPQFHISDFPNLCATGSIENPVWYEFIACESMVSIEIIPGNCSEEGIGGTGIQGSINEGCEASSSLDCNDNPNQSSFTLTITAVVGETYFLVLDGFGTSICEYDINILQGISDVELNTINGDNEISVSGIETCNEPNDIITFNVTECLATGNDCTIPTLLNSDLICYKWTFTPDIVDIVSDSTLSSIEVIFLEENVDVTVSVERCINPILASCSTGDCDDPDPIVVSVNFLETVINPKTIICPGEQVDICGAPIGIDGVYECLDEINCILTIDTVEFATPDEQDLGIMFLCPDDCFELEGVEYCDRQQYEIVSEVDCGISFIFEIEDAFITIQEPNQYPILDCSDDCGFVSMIVTTNYIEELEFIFTDPNGSVISNDNFTEVCIPGEYTFEAFSPSASATCIELINFTIDIDDMVPEVELNGEVLTCMEREAALSFETMDDVLSFEWSGPAVENPTNFDAFATLPGWYYLEFQSENGCTGIDSIEITEVLEPADIDIDFDNLTCDVAMTTLMIITDDIEVDSVIWTGLGDFISRELEPIIIDTGTYTANIFASNGCDYSEIIKVLGFYDEPTFDIAQDDFWFCDSESVLLTSSIITGDNVSYQWFTETGEIISDETGTEVTVGSIGTYFLQVTDGENGCVNIDTFTVQTDPGIPSEIDIVVTNPSCFGMEDGMIEIENIEGGADPFTFMMGDVITSEFVITDLAPDTYEFTLIDGNGCELNKTIEIVSPAELTAELEGPEKAIFNETVVLNSVYVDSLVDVDIINWYNSAGEFLGTGDEYSHLFLMTETFTMELIDVNGCSVIRTITIRLDEDFDYYLPTIFTPDDNGLNDTFRFFSQNAPGEVQSFEIYDRWGNKVYELGERVELPGNNLSWGWDGRVNGNNAIAGVYVYYAVVETLGVTKELKGSVTLVR